MGIVKAYVEAQGLDFLNGGTARIGKRFYYRPDIHMLDLQYINMNGTGAGLDRIPAGPGKFPYAFFKDNDINTVSKTGVVSTKSAVRQNFIYGEIPVNENGTLDLAATYIIGEGKDNDAFGQKTQWLAIVGIPPSGESLWRRQYLWRAVRRRSWHGQGRAVRRFGRHQLRFGRETHAHLQ